MDYTLSKAERLNRKAAFEHLFKHTKAQRFGVLKLYCALDVPPELVDSQLSFAVAVPKKLFRHATDRNLHKRRIREAYRLHKHILLQLLQPTGRTAVVMFVVSTPQACSYAQLEKQIIRSLQHLANSLLPPASPAAATAH